MLSDRMPAVGIREVVRAETGSQPVSILPVAVELSQETKGISDTCCHKVDTYCINSQTRRHACCARFSGSCPQAAFCCRPGPLDTRVQLAAEALALFFQSISSAPFGGGDWRSLSTDCWPSRCSHRSTVSGAVSSPVPTGRKTPEKATSPTIGKPCTKHSACP